MNTRPSLDAYFLEMARSASLRSKDPSTKVGAVIVRPDATVLSTGYNGFPRKIEDTPERLNNREVKLNLTIHAEHNALLFAKESVNGCTIYVYPFQPCLKCAVMLIQAGITRVVAPSLNSSKWEDSFIGAQALFDEAGVQFDAVG